MPSLLIIGAGGFGREVLNYAIDAGLDVRGFLDDRVDAVGAPEHGVDVIGSVDDFEFDANDDAFVIAVGDATVRNSLAAKLKRRRGRLAVVVHPTAYLARDATLGAGSILCPFAMVATRATVGENVAINTYASVAHDAVVGANSVLSPYSTINGNVTLGDNSFLGTHAAVVPGRRIGKNTKVAAGAVVTTDVGAGHLVSGNPARGRAMFPVDDE